MSLRGRVRQIQNRKPEGEGSDERTFLGADLKNGQLTVLSVKMDPSMNTKNTIQ